MIGFGRSRKRLQLIAALAVVTAGCSGPRGPSNDPELVEVGALVWGGEQKIVASDSAELDQFGAAVAIAGDDALVGAYGESNYRGAAYVLGESGNSWTEVQKLAASDGAEGDEFGWSV